MTEQVVLVDDRDQPIGAAEKLHVHRLGLLHRAFSVVLFNQQGEVLLQRRARDKYHSGGLWTNTCCGHPQPDEPVQDAAERRLEEEMGIVTPLREVATFLYRKSVSAGLTEHEYDHVFIGEFNGVPAPDPAEADEWRWAAVNELRAELEAKPEAFTAWLPYVLESLSHAGVLPG